MKNWRHDGEAAVIREMIDDALISEHGCAIRSLTSSTEHVCEVCLQPIRAWTSYQIVCSIEDGEPVFSQQHIYCPE